MRHRLIGKPRGFVDQGERGAALIVVMFVMLSVLVGGLAAVAVTSGELSGAAGFRTRETTEACAEAGLEKIRALMPNATSFSEAAGTLSSGVTLSYRPGHYNDQGDDHQDESAITILDPSQYALGALMQGSNVTNGLAVGSGASPSGDDADDGDLRTQINVISTTAICRGDKHGVREMQLIFRYGTSLGVQ